MTEATIISPVLGPPGVTVFHGEQGEDQVFRRVINDWSVAGTEWNLDGTESLGTEMELQRGIVLARELVGAGAYVFNAQGTCRVNVNGATGQWLLRTYISTNGDPLVAKASMTLVSTHTVSIPDPGASHSGNGAFLWTLELIPLGQADLTNLMAWRSRCSYQKWLTTSGSGPADTLTDVVAGDIISGTTDFHKDTVIVHTMQKNVLTGTFNSTKLRVYAADAYVRNGVSGQA